MSAFQLMLSKQISIIGTRKMKSCKGPCINGRPDVTIYIYKFLDHGNELIMIARV